MAFQIASVAIILVNCVNVTLQCQTMGAKDKKRFEDMAERDKQRFDKEMANYTPPAGQKKKKKKKDPNAPKRSLLVSFCDLITKILCPA